MTEELKTESVQTAAEDENHIIQERRAKLAKLRENGIAFPNDFRRTDLFGDLRTAWGDKSAEQIEANLALAGPGSNTPLPEHPSLLKALAPMLPVIILVVASIWFKHLRLSVGSAMILGTIYALAVSRANPAEISRKFFDGMGSGYAKIMGIIIAAGVFAAGLRACGLVDLLVDYLKHAQEVAKLGGSVGPFLLGLLTGSGDAAAFAFNEAVTPHAAEFGMTIPDLGVLAALAGSFGRQASPLCGGLILTDDQAPVELLGMRMIDGIIAQELGYYKEVFARDGLQGILDDFNQ